MTCTKVLPYMRLIPVVLFADALPLTNIHHPQDGVGKGDHYYGTLGGNGAGCGPNNWQPYGDGWGYGGGKGNGDGEGWDGYD